MKALLKLTRDESKIIKPGLRTFFVTGTDEYEIVKVLKINWVEIKNLTHNCQTGNTREGVLHKNHLEIGGPTLAELGYRFEDE